MNLDRKRTKKSTSKKVVWVNLGYNAKRRPYNATGLQHRRCIPEIDNCPIIIDKSGIQRQNFPKVSGGVVSQVDCIHLLSISASNHVALFPILVVFAQISFSIQS